MPDRASTAAILHWQSRYRLALCGLVAVSALLLKAGGVLSGGSVVALRLGAPRAIALGAAVALAYAVTIVLIAGAARRRQALGDWAVAVTIAADVLCFHAAIFCVTPPAWYERALVLSAFGLNLTMLSFGWRAAGWNLVAIVAAYLVMVGLAAPYAAPAREHVWTVALFAAGNLIFLLLLGSVTERLDSIAYILQRAQDGDFSLSYDEAGDRQPDRVTVLGSSYNRLRAHLASVALTDPLTGCYNARGFEQLAAREAARAARAGQVVSVIALDVDHFKALNDTYGHMVGDDVLRELGARLREAARAADIVARTGGEEFTVLVTDSDEDGAAQLAVRLTDAVRGRSFAAVPGRSTVTLSAGVATLDATIEDVVRLLRVRADEALYAAKRAGRDRVVRWGATRPAGAA